MADHTDICHRWAAAWGASSPDDWIATYHPDALYTDHAFTVRRKGHENLRHHWRLWRNSMPDFEMTVDRLSPVETLPDAKRRYSMRTHNAGTFTNDLLAVKASGRKFWFYGVVDLVVDKDGLIEKVDEWYCRAFDSMQDLDGYRSDKDYDITKLGLP